MGTVLTKQEKAGIKNFCQEAIGITEGPSPGITIREEQIPELLLKALCDIDTLTAEIERLDKTLEKIATKARRLAGRDNLTAVCMRLNWIEEQARQALREKEG